MFMRLDVEAERRLPRSAFMFGRQSTQSTPVFARCNDATLTEADAWAA